MIYLIHVITRMVRLGYSREYIYDLFTEAESGSTPLEMILSSVDINTTPSQLELMYSSLPKWRSAYAVVIMREESSSLNPKNEKEL